MDRTDTNAPPSRRAAGPGGPFRWDKAAVAEALRRRRDQGLELNFTSIETTDSGLCKAACRLYESFDEALRAAGIDPASVRKRIAWDKAAVVKALRQRHARGEAVNLAAVRRSDPRLGDAIQRYFGCQDAALRAAGIDSPVVEWPLWSRAKVVEALRARADAGLEMNVMAIRESDKSLHYAMSRYFPSREDALRAAGIDPAAVAKQRSWDGATVLARLRERLADGLAVNDRAIKASDSGLSQAIWKYFGSHDQALREIGVDPATVRRAMPWDRERVVEALRDRAAKGLEVHSSAVARSDVKLGGAIPHYFESHDDALRAAGIDPAAVRRWFPWDRQTIIAALRERQGRGLGLSTKAMETEVKLRAAMSRYFGSHDAALRAAGIDPESVRLKRPDWSESEILDSLRALARDGVLPWPLSRHGNTSLDSAARHRFGSVEAAAAAAGLRYDRPPARGGIGHWTEQTVLQSLRDLHREGHDLRYRPMKQHRQPLFFAAKQFFGSYVNAVRQAGIDYTNVVRAQLERERRERAARPDEEPAEEPEEQQDEADPGG